MLSVATQTIVTICNLPINYKTALNYLISEFCDNLIDHSKSENGYISFQYYKQNKYLDLCICDAGQGFLKSYLNYSGNKEFDHISSDIEAIEAVLEGNSTKQTKERGFGVRTSINLIVNGLGGNVVLGSGSAISSNIKKTITIEQLGWYHQGAFVVIRIPLQEIKKNFSLYDFVE